ncbi:MAG: ABC transporter substrate-binding protein [Phycisphaerales bacterium]
MTRPRRLLAVGFLVALAFPLGFCGSHHDTGTVQIELWTLALRPHFDDYVAGVIEGFENKHPGVQVVWVDVPFSAVERKFIAASAADRAPDVINLSDLMFARFAGAGAFLDLRDRLPGDPGDRYHAGALAVGDLDSGLFALPWYLTTQARIVNEAVLTDLGLTPESLGQTWPALRDQAQEIFENSGGMLFTQPLGQDSQLPVMMLADGVIPFSTDESGALRASFTRREVIEWVRAWVSFYRSGAMPRQAATNGFEHLIEVYQEGRVGVLNTGSNFLARVRGASPSIYDSTSVSPPIVGQLGRAHVAVMPVSVCTSTEHPDLSIALAWELTSAENQLAFCRLASILPSTPAALEDSFFKGPTRHEIETGDEKIGQARAIVATALEHAVAFTPRLECWPILRRSFNEHIKRALLGDTPLERVLADVERDWNDILDGEDQKRALAGEPRASMDAIPMPPPVGSVIGMDR